MTGAPSGLYKVEGSGNDFVAGIGRWARRLAEDAQLTRRVCDRRLGIGADGTLAVTAENEQLVRVVYRNSDGSVEEFCGNGTRCVARVAVDFLGCAHQLDVATGWATIAAEVHGSVVALELPSPTAPPRHPEIGVDTGVGEVALHVIGVPHIVARAEGLEVLDLKEIAATLRTHSALSPAGANVNLYEIVDAGVVAVRTWERGVEGETLSCGSGMVSVALQVMADTGSRKLEMAPLSGDRLTVEALGEPPLCAVRFTGPTRIVAEVIPGKELIG